MICGLGVDLIGIARVEKLLVQGGLERFFTPEEQAYVRGRGAAAADSAAGIFAAKEAMVKALGTGIAPVGLLEVAVAHDELGAPVAVLGERALARMRVIGAARMLLSITHAEGMAAAVAVADSD
jgi:holo-[acyl-carrier protein] synthase